MTLRWTESKGTLWSLIWSKSDFLRNPSKNFLLVQRQFALNERLRKFFTMKMIQSVEMIFLHLLREWITEVQNRCIRINIWSTVVNIWSTVVNIWSTVVKTCTTLCFKGNSYVWNYFENKVSVMLRMINLNWNNECISSRPQNRHSS